MYNVNNNVIGKRLLVMLDSYVDLCYQIILIFFSLIGLNCEC